MDIILHWREKEEKNISSLISLLVGNRYSLIVQGIGQKNINMLHHYKLNEVCMAKARIGLWYPILVGEADTSLPHVIFSPPFFAAR